MDASAIPSIDLDAWINNDYARQSVASQWDSAFQGSGLVYLTNHHMEPLYHRVAQEWREFCAMAAEEKDKFSSPVLGHGYNCIGKEAVGLSNSQDIVSEKSVLADPVESLGIGYSDAFDGTFPRESNGYVGGDRLRDACVELYQALDKKVIRPCLAIISMALGLDIGSLENRWFAKGPGSYQLRLARYRPRNDDNVEDENREVLYAEHTDYDGLTFLWRNQTNGLQALIEDVWHDVPVMKEQPDAIVINLGDLMEFWTRGYWHSPLHRVMRTRSKPAQEEMSDLVSIVFFSGPHQETKLLPLPSQKLNPFNQQDREIITAGQHVQNKIAKTDLNKS